MSQLDKLFSDKLADHAMKIPGDTWEKVEAGLSKKDKITWARWAAAVLLGGLLLGTIWLRYEESPTSVAQEEPASPLKNEKEIQRSVVSPNKEEKTIAKNEVRPKMKNKSGKRPGKELIPVQHNEDIPSLHEEPVNLTAQIAGVQEETSKSIVLTYTLDPIEIPKAEVAPSVVTPATGKKEKSLRRMMTFAKNVKNGDTPLMGLRDMKEELFALDFKKKTTTKKQ